MGSLKCREQFLCVLHHISYFLRSSYYAMQIMNISLPKILMSNYHIYLICFRVVKCHYIKKNLMEIFKRHCGIIWSKFKSLTISMVWCFSWPPSSLLDSCMRFSLFPCFQHQSMYFIHNAAVKDIFKISHTITSKLSIGFPSHSE